MPLIEPSIVEEAKRIDLLTYLQLTNPYDIQKIRPNEYKLRSHDSIKISNGLWYQFSTGKGGRTALDYLIKVEGMTFPDAMSKLMGHNLTNIPTQKPAEKKLSKLLLPEKHTNNDKVFKYLTSVRCLDGDIIRDLMDKNLIYESTYGSHTNAVFVGTDKDGIPRQVAIRGVLTLYKSEASGSDKHFAFNIPAIHQSDTLRIFESAIDLMSFLTMSKKYKKSNSEHLLSLSGIYQPKSNIEDSHIPISISQYLTDYSGIKKIMLHLDNDRAGRESAEAFKIIMPQIGLEVIDKPVPYGKDVNDYLRLRNIDRRREER